MKQALNLKILPTYEIVDGFIILIGALLLIIPGFISDFIGIILLTQITRKTIRNWLLSKIKSQYIKKFGFKFNNSKNIYNKKL